MPVAVLHDEFTPGGGRGGVCASGEVIIGPNASGYAVDRIAVFDPVSKTADTYGVTLSGTVTTVGHGCAWNGGVAMTAGSPSAVLGVLVAYPDGTYDVTAASLSGHAGLHMLVSDGSTLVAVRTGTGSAPQVFTPGSGWSAGSTSVNIYTQPQMSGSVAVAITSLGHMVSINMSTGDVTTLHSSVGTPLSYGHQSVIVGGRLWYLTSTTNLRGVRIADGNVVNIAVPAVSYIAGSIPLATDGTRLFVIDSYSAVYQVDPVTFSTVVHTLPSVLGYTYAMFAAGGKIWAPGENP